MRQERDPLRALLPIGSTRDLATCGVVRCEVARGVRNPKALRALRARWDVMLYVPTDNALWAEIEAMVWRLDRQGTPLPLPDVVIACCALRIGAVVLTHDSDFKRIPGLRSTDHIY